MNIRLPGDLVVWKHLLAAIIKVSRHGILKSSYFLLCFNLLYLSYLWICCTCTLHSPWSFLNFKTGMLLKGLKGEQNWSQTVRFYTVLLRLFADMVHVCLSLGRGHVFVMSSMPSAIKVCYINFSKWALKTGWKFPPGTTPKLHFPLNKQQIPFTFMGNL